jgi:type VI secretion system protein ImpL
VTLIAILLGFIAVLLIGLIVAAVMRLSRARQDEQSSRSFGAAMRTAHAAMGARDPYQIPRILVTGAPAAVDALCRAWRLTSVGAPTWFGRVWHDAEGVLLAEPGDALALPSADRQLKAWRRILRALLRNRAGRPLDAILWVIPVETLTADDGQPRDMSAVSLESSRKISALQRQFGLMLPIYIVISGCDALPGFEDLADRLQGASNSTPLGWASPYPVKQAYDPAWIDAAFGSMRAALAGTITELGTLDGAMGEALFLLPQRIDSLRVPFGERVDLALRGAADGTAPLLRGVYCVGAVPDALSTAADATAGAARPSAPRRSPAFAARLWRDVLLAEQGLALPMPRVLALRTRWHRFATVAAATLVIIWCAGMAVSWWHLRHDAQTLAAAYNTLALAQTRYRDSDKGAAAVTGALETVADQLRKVPRWRLTSPFMPLSYAFLNNQLDDAQMHVLRGLIFAPLHDGLVQRVARLTCAADLAGEPDGDLSTRPQDLKEFVVGTRLVADTARTEHLIAMYNELVQAGSGNLVMLSNLMRETVGVNLAPEHIAERAQFDTAVRTTGIATGTLSPSAAQDPGARQRVILCFEQAFDSWFDRVYADSTLASNAAQVQSSLTALRAPGAAPTDAMLSGLADHIDALAAQLDAADHGWAGAHGKELVPGLTSTFDVAKRLQLIGPEPVQAALAHEQEAHDAFTARWLESSSLPGVMSAAPAGGLQLAGDLAPLRDALRALLSQPFVPSLNKSKEVAIESVDVASLQRALAILPAYQQYVAGPLVQAPQADRGALLAVAQNDVARSMVDALATPARTFAAQQGNTSAGDEAAQFDALRKSALNVIAAFDSVGRDDLAASTALRVSDQALVILRASDAQLQSFAPFRPRRGDFSDWDGHAGGALRAYDAATPQALQAYLAAQTTVISDAAENTAAALDWLSVQKPPLDAADARLVSRWKALSADLAQYRAKSPASALVAVQSIIADQLDKLDLENCDASLERISVPQGGDVVSGIAVRLVASAREQCFRLQMGTGMLAYEDIRSFFARYLAGRFPFSADANAPGADLQQTAAFVALLDKNLAQAQLGLAAAAAVGRGPTDGAQRFVSQLARARPWLDAMLARGADGAMQGVALAVEWRVDRADEVGADQVIEWKLTSGSDAVAYPSSGQPSAHWRPGLPVSISLRWAKDGPWQPMFDAAQPTLSSDQGTATWSSGDTWALLRLVRLHQLPADASLTGAGTPGGSVPRLLLTVPVRDRGGAIQTARMFMRIGIAGEGKTPLVTPALPVSAPDVGRQGMARSAKYPIDQYSDTGNG